MNKLASGVAKLSGRISSLQSAQQLATNAAMDYKQEFRTTQHSPSVGRLAYEEKAKSSASNAAVAVVKAVTATVASSAAAAAPTSYVD